MHFTMHLEGTTALLMHNPRMVDPNYELNRKIKELTKKKKKTDDDHHNIEKFEWLGGLYTAATGICDSSSRPARCASALSRRRASPRKASTSSAPCPSPIWRWTWSTKGRATWFN